MTDPYGSSYTSLYGGSPAPAGAASVQVTGVPTQPGTYTFTVTATDSAGNATSKTLTITVGAVPLPPGPAPPESWHFLLTAPQPDGTYLTEITQAQARSLAMRTGPDQYSEVTADILGTGPAAQYVTELSSDIQVLRNSQILFCGRVGATQDTLDASSHRLTVSAVDYRQVLRRRSFAPSALGEVFTDVDVADIAWGIIDPGFVSGQAGFGMQKFSGGNLGISRGIGHGGVGTKQTISWPQAQFAGDAITQLAQMAPGQFDWDITPYGQADLRLDIWAPNRGSDNGVVLEYGGSLVDNVQRSVDPSAYANSQYLTGQAPASGGSAPTPVYIEAADLASRAEGRWDQITGTDWTSGLVLTTQASWYLAAGEVITPAYTIQMKPGAWDGPSHIWMGDLVTVRIKSGRLAVNDKLTVQELDISVDANNVSTVTLTIGRLPWRLEQQIPRMLRRLRLLETR